MRALVLADSGAAAQGVVNRVKVTVLVPLFRTPARHLIVPILINVLFGSTARRDQPDLVATWRDRFLAQDPESMLIAGHAMIDRDDVTGRLTEITVPTLVIVGEEDVDPGVAASVSMAARIPGARFVALPDTGHLSALEQPDAFGAALLQLHQHPDPTRPVTTAQMGERLRDSPGRRRRPRLDGLGGAGILPAPRGWSSAAVGLSRPQVRRTSRRSPGRRGSTGPGHRRTAPHHRVGCVTRR